LSSSNLLYCVNQSLLHVALGLKHLHDPFVDRVDRNQVVHDNLVLLSWSVKPGNGLLVQVQAKRQAKPNSHIAAHLKAVYAVTAACWVHHHQLDLSGLPAG
jgi:hypothetical protein